MTPVLMTAVLGLTACGGGDVDAPSLDFMPGHLELEGLVGQEVRGAFTATNQLKRALQLEVVPSEHGLEISPSAVGLAAGEGQSFSLKAQCPPGPGRFVLPIVFETDDADRQVVFSVRLDCKVDVGEPTSALDLRIIGLAPGVLGRLWVTGPMDFEAWLTSSTFLDEIYPGGYRIVMEEVFDGETRYVPLEPVLEVQVPAEASLEVDVVYERTD